MLWYGAFLARLITKIPLKPKTHFPGLFFQRDDHYMQEMEGPLHHTKYMPAIYTHCYDQSGTRLFAAGGPLQCGIKGNYMGLFQ